MGVCDIDGLGEQMMMELRFDGTWRWLVKCIIVVYWKCWCWVGSLKLDLGEDGVVYGTLFTCAQVHTKSKCYIACLIIFTPIFYHKFY